MTGVELILGLVLGLAAVIAEYAPKILEWYQGRKAAQQAETASNEQPRPDAPDSQA